VVPLRWIVVSASAGCVALTLAACGAVPSEAERTMQVSSPMFTSTESMAVNSDIIVLGTVTGIDKGRKIAEGVESVQFRDVTISIEAVAFSRLQSRPDAVVVQEMGWANGKSVEDEDMPWSKRGDRGYFFLQKDVPGRFGYLGPQARVWS
jgi:hypothetical protein